MVIRSHEVKSDGYEVAHNGKCITVFSAPNYWQVNSLGSLDSYMRLSSVEIKYYSHAYFDHVTNFKVQYLWALLRVHVAHIKCIVVLIDAAFILYV